MSSTQMHTLNASDCPAEMVAGPAKFWEIARPLIAELCSQWSRDGSGLSCAPKTLSAYLDKMYQTLPPPGKPLPETCCPAEYVRTIDANLDNLSWKSTTRSPTIAHLVGQETKREVEREKDRPPWTPGASQLETIKLDSAELTPPKPLHQYPGTQDNQQSIPPSPWGTAIYSNDCVEHDPDGVEVAGYGLCPILRDHDRNSSQQTDSWLSHDSYVGSSSEIRDPSTAIDASNIVATGDAVIQPWPDAHDGPPLPSLPYDVIGTDSAPDSMSFPDRPGIFLEDPSSGVSRSHTGDIGLTHPMNQQPYAAPWANPVVPTAAISGQSRPMAWVPMNTGHVANNISVQSPRQGAEDPELPLFHTEHDVGFCQGSGMMLNWPADAVLDERRCNITCSSVDGPRVPLCRTTPSRVDSNRLLDELQGVQQMSAFTINVVSASLRSRLHTPDLQITSGPWDQTVHRDSLVPSPLPQVLLAPLFSQTECALIEVHPTTMIIIHYMFSTAPGASSAWTVAPSLENHVCTACRATMAAVSHQLPVAGLPRPDWQIEHRPIPSETGPGVTLLWTLHQRVAGSDVWHGPPKDFPFHMTQSLMPDIFPGQIPFPSPSSALGDTKGPSLIAKARQRWLSFVGRRTDSTALAVTWEQIAQIPVAGQPMGWEQADRLMQLVFNIASPATLVGVKHQLLHLRARGGESPHAFTRTVTGVFEAGLWHRMNEHASRVGLALTCWSVHQHRRRRQDEGCADPTGQTVTDIFHHLRKEHRDHRLVEEKVREWSKRAWPWNQLIRAARGSPNILCFLPQGTNAFRGQEGICMTEYRTLRKVQFVVMEQILQRFRPQLLCSVPTDFFEIFLYNHVPPYRFAIEQWTDEEILREPVDSPKFDSAFHVIAP